MKRWIEKKTSKLGAYIYINRNVQVQTERDHVQAPKLSVLRLINESFLFWFNIQNIVLFPDNYFFINMRSLGHKHHLVLMLICMDMMQSSPIILVLSYAHHHHYTWFNTFGKANGGTQHPKTIKNCQGNPLV
jgi:hypothetical protein